MALTSTQADFLHPHTTEIAMRIRAFLFAAAFGTALTACADAGPVEPSGKPALGVNSTREIYVDAVTYRGGVYSSSSGGYAKGWATPVSSGTGYQMGDVEADGNDGQYMTENTGYTGQLDAFKYDSGCTFQWLRGPHTVISTAATIYLSDFPTVDYFTLKISCPS